MFTPNIPTSRLAGQNRTLREEILEAIKERLDYLPPRIGHARIIELSGPTQEITPTVTIMVPKGTGRFWQKVKIIGFGFLKNTKREMVETLVETEYLETVDIATLTTAEQMDVLTLLDGIIAGIDDGTLVSVYTMICTKDEFCNNE